MPSADTHEDTSPSAEEAISRSDPTIRDPAPLFAEEHDLDPDDELSFDRPLFLESPPPEEVTSVSSPEEYQPLIESSKEPDTSTPVRDMTPEGPTKLRNLAPQSIAAPSEQPKPLPALPIETLFPSSLDEEDQTPTIPATPPGLELELFSDLSPLPLSSPPPPPLLSPSPTQRSSAYQVPAAVRPAAPSTHDRVHVSWIPLLIGILVPLITILIVLALVYL